MQFIKHQSDEDGSWIKGKTSYEHINISLQQYM